MNVFEQDAESLTADGFIAVWVSFKCAIADLLDSYNAGPRGEVNPAEICEDQDRLIVFKCSKGDTRDTPFSRLMVSVRAARKDRELTIDCTIQNWTQRIGGKIHPTVENEKKIRFSLGPDGKSLRFRSETLTPYEAAEKLTETALLRR